MDRTGLIAVLFCVLVYLALNVYFAKLNPPAPVKSSGAAPSAAISPTTNLPPAASATPVISSPALSEAAPASPAPAMKAAAPEKLNFLENGFIKVTFTTKGASIEEVDLKKHKEGEHGDVVLNQESHDNVMALSGWPGADTAAFQVESAPPEITYTASLPNSVQWTRSYHLGPDYTLAVKDTLANTGKAEAVLPAYSISVGRATPLLVQGHYQPISNQYVGAGWLTTQKFHLTTINSFNPGSWFSSHPGVDLISSITVDNNPVRWLAVENQFFAVLLTPAAELPIQQATFHCFNERTPDGSISPVVEPNIEASADFAEVRVPAGKELDLNYTLYAGPKEHGRLNALGENQGELMNYDGVLPFSFLIVPMLWILHFFYGLVHNYGVAIILLTLVVKGCTWPLQSIANRSGKRMQAVAPKLKELQAKYKDQPEKLNTETFALYRDYGVNPFGGCLPAFVQMPVFFSLYFMLQNAVELRGQSFLWVHDLTQPDTVWSHTLPFVIPFLNISHLALNPLPLMVTGLTMVMMRMTPQIGDPQQAKIAQFMPLIFLFIFYNFAAGLSLYYVINNCVSIIQIYRNLRTPLPELKRKPKKS
jgi:YidC/Oxa1 family membrane protein insertase